MPAERNIASPRAPGQKHTLVMTTLPDPGECSAHLAARAFTSTPGLLAKSVLAAGETTQFPAGAAAERRRAPPGRPACAATPAATRRASMLNLAVRPPSCRPSAGVLGHVVQGP
jgi:hypothetical protein